MITSSFRARKGNVAVYVAVSVTAIMFLLLASLQLTLSSYTIAVAWDVRRQREVESRSVAQIVKESLLSKYETAPSTDSRALNTIIAERLLAAWPTSALTVTDTTNYTGFSAPSNPQWPSSVPAATSTLDFTSAAASGLGRNFQALLAAGPVADLGTSTFTFQQASTATPGETPIYQVTARYFSVPLTNFEWVAYGDPSTAGGVSATVPSAPTFTRASGFQSPIAHSFTKGDTGTFPEMYPTMSNGATSDYIPSFYRDIVSATWNAFAYWTGATYQNGLLSNATSNSCLYNFLTPAATPTGAGGSVTWDGTRAILNMSVVAAPRLLVFNDLNGGGTLRITGDAVGVSSNPVVVVVRNYSATRTIIELSGNNTRPVLIYALNSRIAPLTAGLSIRGGVLLFNNSAVSSGFTLAGSLAYPQSFTSVPPITVTPDTTATNAFASIVPRAFLVSTRGIIP